MEKTINRHDVDALVLGIDENKNFEENQKMKTHVVMKIFHQRLTKQKKKD